MKAEKFISGILTLVVIYTPMSSAAAQSPSKVRAALKAAGGNRSELETALLAVKGKDSDYVIANASQFDLVNLTSLQIIENVTYARKVHEALPYLGGKLDEKLWREWVLPYRVLDEDLSFWRKDFHERMQPVISGKKATKEVADAIVEWLCGADAHGKRRVLFGTAEDRLKSAQSVVQTGEGACGEMCLVYVCLLRSVGIPARHCVTSWWYHRNDRHFFCEYWDNQLKEWVPVDSSDDLGVRSKGPRQQTALGNWNSLVMHAHPAYASQSDVYGKGLWEECVQVTPDIGETYGFRVSADGPGGVDACVWNWNAWRRIAFAATQPEGGATLEFGDNKRVDRPVLFTAIRGGKLRWALKRPSKGMAGVDLEWAEPGKCITWSAASQL